MYILGVSTFGDWQHYMSDSVGSSFMSLCVVREEGQGIVNHAYRRNVKQHASKVAKLGEKL